MELQTLTYLVVGASFLLYIGIALASRASSTGEFYVAGGGVHPVANGLATAADWMSAASFISMAGLIASPMMGAYNVAKHGVVALMATLERELRSRKSPVTASVAARLRARL